ncbi:hypothetical protein [Mycobacteroides abscessus]|nr:hypothetical protein [Mycobacteroides abscessus]
MTRRTRTLADTEQLDMFAEIEAVAFEEWLATAPCLYASTARGFYL